MLEKFSVKPSKPFFFDVLVTVWKACRTSAINKWVRNVLSWIWMTIFFISGQSKVNKLIQSVDVLIQNTLSWSEHTLNCVFRYSLRLKYIFSCSALNSHLLSFGLFRTACRMSCPPTLTKFLRHHRRLPLNSWTRASSQEVRWTRTN